MKFNGEKMPEPQKKSEGGMLGHAKKFLRSKVALGAAVAVTSPASVSNTEAQSMKGSGEQTFEQAFDSAKGTGKPQFVWEGKTYGTRIASPELANLYKESKDFLETYYKSDYFKSKTIYPQDSSMVLSALVDQEYPKLAHEIDSVQKMATEDEEWIQGPGAGQEGYQSVSRELSSLKSELDTLYSEANHAVDSFSKTEAYPHALDSTENELQADYLNELNRKIPVVLTEEKGKKTEDGHYHYDPEGKHEELYISHKKTDTSNITTAVHELTHKATMYLLQFSPNSMNELNQEALDWINANRDSLLVRYPELDTEYVYLSEPSEIIARMSSARFWLHKHDASYDATKPFTDKDFQELLENYMNLPYDVKQLMDVFLDKDVFIKNMNTY